MQIDSEGFRLTPQQKRLWMLRRDRLTYCSRCAMVIRGRLEIERLESVIQQTLERNEIFRTSFCLLPGMKVPVQVISAKGRPDCSIIDLTELSDREQQDRIEGLWWREQEHTFDFKRGSIWRTLVVILSPESHVMILNFPSLCVDSRSLQNVIKEFGRCYEANLRDEKVSSETLPYIKFSEWQNELLQDEDLRESREYWIDRRELAMSAPLRLPFEMREGRGANAEPGLHARVMDSDTIRRIKDVAALRGASTEVFLLACWQTLLWRLTKQDDIIVGCIFDGRPYPVLDEAIGLLAKYLPIHCRFHDRFRFSDLLLRIDEETRKACERQESFTWEISAADVEAIPYFPLGFDFEQRQTDFEVAGLSFSIERYYSCIDRFNLRLSCIALADSLVLEFHNAPEVFQKEDVTRIGRYFMTLLQSVLQNLNVFVGELDILSAEERQQLLLEFNNITSSYPADKTFCQLFEEQVAHTPDRVALVSEGKHLTFAALNAKANRLAHYLHRRGVAPDVLVAICLDRSNEMIVGLLGVLKAGGAYVPIDPETPQRRMALQLADSRARVIVSETKLKDHLPDFGGEVAFLDQLQTENEEQADISAGAFFSQQIVYVIYTSGSTGAPKGVAVTHQSLVNYTICIREKLKEWGLRIADGLHFAAVSTLAADLGNTSIFPSLISGGCLHLLSREEVTDGRLFARYLARNSIDVLKIVPSHLSSLFEPSATLSQCSLRRVILGGEPLPFKLVERICETSDHCKVVNHYGPTETTVGSMTLDDVRPGRYFDAVCSTVPIGRPIANTVGYILDQHMAPTPLGIPGELYIGGAGLARGYWGRPDLTAERYLPHPLDNDGSARLYKTGDLARYLGDGNIEYLGRLDYQVKIRGFRVEPEEIERLIGQHPAVRKVVVVSRADTHGDTRMIAYLVVGPELTITISDLRNFLGARLPEYMLPTRFIFLKDIPLTPNGKIDRSALQSSEYWEEERERPKVAPETAIQRIIADNWTELLGFENFDLQDDFFKVGGHSLLATQLLSRLREELQVELELRHIFEAPSVAGLARIVESIQWWAHSLRAAADIPRDGREQGEL